MHLTGSCHCGAVRDKGYIVPGLGDAVRNEVT